MPITNNFVYRDVAIVSPVIGCSLVFIVMLTTSSGVLGGGILPSLEVGGTGNLGVPIVS